MKSGREMIMISRVCALSLLAIVTAIVPSTAVSAGLAFLKTSPIYYFDDTDRKMMMDAAQQVLNDADGSAMREWKNPGTSASGKVQGLGKFRSEDGLECRKVKVSNQARGLESEATYPVCRDTNGEWRLASGKQLVPA